MTNLLKSRNVIYRVALLFIVTVLVGSATIFSRARSQTTSLTITNSTSREIKHLYLSAPDNNNWGPDLLNDNAIAAGASATLSISCNSASTKVIAEDQNGCFVSTVVSCSGSVEWTITSDLTPDCGG
ncbi:MAG: hypothetical protein QOD75_1662 [Blastocatellia bacterium]|jgi:hypothetical protein|nr:hypothetical protein [Blastocatellia bacterium]